MQGDQNPQASKSVWDGHSCPSPLTLILTLTLTLILILTLTLILILTLTLILILTLTLRATNLVIPTAVGAAATAEWRNLLFAGAGKYPSPSPPLY
jgi:hypothetical protein